MPAKFAVRITRTAERDVDGIWNYIAQDSPDAAERFMGDLLRQTMTLERFPERCPLIAENELMGTAYRHLIHEDYRTVFRVSGRTVLVLRIIRGSRLLDRSMLEEL